MRGFLSKHAASRASTWVGSGASACVGSRANMWHPEQARGIQSKHVGGFQSKHMASGASLYGWVSERNGTRLGKVGEEDRRDVSRHGEGAVVDENREGLRQKGHASQSHVAQPLVYVELHVGAAPAPPHADGNG